MSTLRIALRSWLKSPLFVCIAVVTLALAIGANTLVFSLVNTILLRDPPYPGADRLVSVWNTYPKQGLEKAALSVPDYLDRKDLAAFEASALFHARSVNLAEDGAAPERLRALRVTPSFFPLFGTRFALGRGFIEAEATHEADRFVVLSHDFWQSRFAGDPAILGRQIRLDGRFSTVVGVAAADFISPFRNISLYVPFAFSPNDVSDNARGREYTYMAARLRAGATIEQATKQGEAALLPLIDRIPQARAFLDSTGFGPLVRNYLEDAVGETRPLLLLLQGGVALLLLIACANVANLFLLRAIARQREMAIRVAMGARLSQLARQLLAEGLLVSLAGGAAGVLLSAWGIELLRRIGFADLPRMRELSIDGNVLLFTVGVAVLTGAAFGLAPLLAVRRDVSTEALKSSGNTATAGRSTGWLRNGLIATEVALAFVLLAGRAMLARSFLKVRDVPVGFQHDNLLTGMLSLPQQRYDTDEKATAFYERLTEGVRALPGVTVAGITSQLPFGGGMTTGAYQLPGVELPPGVSPHANLRWVTRDYLPLLGVPLVRGRIFERSDSLEAPKVAIIDEFLAARHFPGKDPVGRQMRIGADPDGPLYQIIGVVGTIRHGDLAEPVAKETIYLSLEQDARSSLTLAVRTAAAPSVAASGIREVLRGIDPELPIFDLRTMSERIESSLDSRRAPMLLLLGFGAVSLALCAIGIYGIIAFAVSQRVREIGVRMALGAEQGQILRLVLRQGLALAAIGTIVGAVLALVGGRLLQDQLFGVSPHDPVSLSVAALIVMAGALVGTLFPALRASRLNPLNALRNE